MPGKKVEEIEVLHARGARKHIVLRWTAEKASLEFGADRNTLQKNLRKQSLEPDKDGLYTTLQIAQAIFGDYHAERARKLREDADASAMENAVRRGELVEKAHVFRFCASILTNVRQKILGSPTISEKDKEDLLHELKELFDEGKISGEII